MVLHFRHWPIQRKFAVLISALLFVVFLVLGIFVYRHQRDTLLTRADQRMTQELNSLYDLLDLQVREKQQTVDAALRVAHAWFYQPGKFSVVDTLTHPVTATHQLSQQTHTATLTEWQYDGQSLLTHHNLVDEVRGLTGSQATIFQRIPEGYLRISTNVTRLDGARAVGTFIPRDSPVVQAVERGETYRGRAFVVTEWCATAYEPIFVNGRVEGILYVGIQEKDLAYLKEKLEARKVLHSGFPYLLDHEGQLVVGQSHAFRPSSDTLRQLVQAQSGSITVRQDGQPHHIYYRYFAPYQYLLAIQVSLEELYLRDLRILQFIIVSSFMVGVLLLSLCVSLLLNRQVVRPLARMQQIIRQLAQGKPAAQLAVAQRDEIGQITESVNVLSDGFGRYSAFARQIGEGNFAASFALLSPEDHLGSTLLSMRDQLRTNAEAESRRYWHTQGVARFVEILRVEETSLQKLADRILSNLVAYLKVNQGALFLLDTHSSEPILTMEACYAYERKKYVQDGFRPGEGLVGQVFLERATVHLREIPVDYVRITSGLGGAMPRSLLLVPRAIDDRAEGVLELASFGDFADYQIAFVEKIAENMAAAIASVRNSQRTRQLLEASQQQEEELRAQEEEMRQNNEELATTQEEMERQYRELNDLRTELEAEVKRHVHWAEQRHVAAVHERLRHASAIMQYVIAHHGGLRIDPAQTHTVRLADAGQSLQLPVWWVGDVGLHQQHTLVAEVQRLSGCVATIFQKSSAGYVHISTHVQLASGQRAPYTCLTADSPVVQAIEAGRVYEEKTLVIGQPHHARYEPF